MSGRTLANHHALLFGQFKVHDLVLQRHRVVE